jgi:hypothetical protein
MRWLALLSLEALVGCGSSEHFEKNFVGVWNGSAEIVTPSYYQVLNSTHINIAAVGENKLSIADFCIDRSGPPATVVSATTFDVGAWTCPRVATGRCASVEFATTNGNGELDGGTLTVVFNGTSDGCGLFEARTATFTGIH